MESTDNPQRPTRFRRPQKGLGHFRYASEEAELADARESVRRWWWEYLRLSKTYWLLCQTSGPYNARTLDERLAAIYRKFGNVYDLSFDDWWKKRGARIFEEQKEPPKVIEIASDLSNLSEYRERKILIEIPLVLSRVTIQRKISAILKQHEAERVRNKLEISESAFPINPVRYRLHTLKVMHEVYCLHRELIAKPAALGLIKDKDYEKAYTQRADLFRIGSLLNISPSNDSLIGEEELIRKRQNRMRASVGRFLTRADQLIANVEYGKFPVFKPVKLPERRFTEKHLLKHRELEEQWWALDLTSQLSGTKVIDAKRVHYDEPLRGRQTY